MKYQQAKSLLDRLCDLAILFHASSELRTKMFEALDEHIPHLDQGCFERGCPMDDEPQPHKLSRDLRAALAQQEEGGGNLPPPLQAEPVQEPVAVSVDALAQHIRFVDGNHNLGAGILAEKIVEFLIKLGIGKEQAEPVEPVAWMSDSDVGFEKSEFGATPTVPLYTAPPQRKPLTKEEIRNLCDRVPDFDIGTHDLIEFARAVERAHGIGEQP